MKTISHSDIRKLFPSPIYERGLTYYDEKRVQGLSYYKQKQIWFAEVSGTDNYYVEISVNNLHVGKISAYCDCPAFATYAQCKHIVAVLLELSNKNKMGASNTHLTNKFLEGILATKQERSHLIFNKLPMQVEYFVKLDHRGKIWLEIKTGISHCYIVRNLREFLNNVLHNEEHYFTNKFSYVPNEHYFLQQDLEILQMMLTFIKTGDMFTERSYYSDNAYDRREVLVPPFVFRPLLEQLIHRKLTIQTGDHDYIGAMTVVDESPYSFTITHNEHKELVLRISSERDTIFYEDYKTVFSEGTFYFPKEDQIQMIQQVEQFGIGNQELLISEEQKDTFFSEALPLLKNLSNVEIEEQVSEEIVEYPLRAKLYLEKRDEAIVGELSYHYGSYTIDPFSVNYSSDRILIRDVEKEEYIMHFIEQSNFHYNGKELYIKLENDEEVYEFLYTILPLLDQYVELFLTSDIQSMIVEREPYPSTTVNIESKTNLLEIGFDIEGIDDEEVTEMIESVIEKKRFYRLNSGAIVSLESDEFRSIQRLFDELNVNRKDIQNGTITLPVYKGVQLDELIETKKSYDPSFRRLLHRLNSPEEQIYDVPENLQATLRNYQETGYQWFKSLSEYHLGGILADDMGLGKTLQTITYLLSEPSDTPHLVVVPSSVVYNWRNECQKFAPSLQTVVITGSPDERAQMISESSEADVWITSYGTLRQDIDLYKGFFFKTLVLDEAQFIKNYATKTSKAVREIVAENRFALSGTPIENSLNELWAIFQVILPGLMPNQREFKRLETEKIATLTRPFILRRVKEDVLKELPEKIESVHVSELTKEQKNLYVGYLQELQSEASASFATNSFQKNRMKILAGLTRLRQLCCHPSLFIENYEGRSGKLDELIEMVKTMMENGKRMLIFSQFTSMHDLIIEELERLNIDYFYLHGQTSAQERVEISEAFNQGEKNVFLISLRAGGTGLNLTGADTVILYDLWWNPAVEDQAAGRAHRFGQKNVVQVIRFVTEGTIEEKMYELQQKKRELIDQVIQPGETMLSSLSEEDVRELLNM